METNGDPLSVSEQWTTPTQSGDFLRAPSEDVLASDSVSVERAGVWEVDVEPDQEHTDVVDPLNVCAAEYESARSPVSSDIALPAVVLGNVAADYVYDEDTEDRLEPNLEVMNNEGFLATPAISGGSVSMSIHPMCVEEEDVPLALRSQKRRASTSPKDVDTDGNNDSVDDISMVSRPRRGVKVICSDSDGDLVGVICPDAIAGPTGCITPRRAGYITLKKAGLPKKKKGRLNPTAVLVISSSDDNNDNDNISAKCKSNKICGV